ncbi:MAG: FeoA family protein [Phycisphaeraceae bacterium]
MGITLTQLKTGQAGRVLDLAQHGDIRRRLFDLGMIPGTMVERVFGSPIGDPACYRVRGALIALRASDAEQVRVDV